MKLKIYFYLILFIYGNCFSACIATEDSHFKNHRQVTIEFGTPIPEVAEKNFQVTMEKLESSGLARSISGLTLNFLEGRRHPDLPFGELFCLTRALDSLTIRGNTTPDELGSVLRPFTDGPKKKESLRASIDLRKLYLKGVDVDDRIMQAIASFVKYSQLQSLVFDSCNFCMERLTGIGALWVLLPQNQTLKELQFSQCGGRSLKIWNLLLSLLQKKSSGISPQVDKPLRVIIETQKKSHTHGGPCRASFRTNGPAIEEIGRGYEGALNSHKGIAYPTSNGLGSATGEAEIHVPTSSEQRNPVFPGKESVASSGRGNKPPRNAPPSPRVPRGKSLARTLDLLGKKLPSSQPKVHSHGKDSVA
jgi:hypothetical protein